VQHRRPQRKIRSGRNNAGANGPGYLRLRDCRGNTTAIVAIILVTACVAAGVWLVLTGEEYRGQQRTTTAAQSNKIVLNVVKSIEVTTRPGELCVTFYTDEDAQASMGVGYEQRSPSYRKTKETWFSRQHIMRVNDLKAGQVYFQIRGDLKTGARFQEPVRAAIIPPKMPVPDQVASTTGKDPAQPGETSPTSAATAQGTTLVTATTPGEVPGGTPPTSASPDQHAAVATSTGASSTGDGSIIDTDGSREATAEGTAMEGDNPYSKLPPADPSTAMGKRAIHASTYRVKFGPNSLPAEDREVLENKIRELYKQWNEYGDAETSRELALTYLEFRDYRKAFRFASEVLKEHPDDVDMHNLRLSHFKTFGMGWKIQETYKKLIALDPSNAELRANYAKDTALYGDHKTLGPADKGDLQ